MARRRHRSGSINAWPGYVDALSSLLMVVTFVLLVFVLGQEFLSATITQREHALENLKQELTHLSGMLSLSEAKVKTLSSAEQEQRAMVATLKSQLDERQHQLDDMQTHSKEVESAQLGSIADLSSQITELTRQLQAVSSALEIEKKNEVDKDARIAELGRSSTSPSLTRSTSFSVTVPSSLAD